MAVVRYDHTPIYNLPSRIRIQPGKTHQYCFRISIFIECRCRPSECFIGIYRQYYPPLGLITLEQSGLWPQCDQMAGLFFI